MIARSHSCAGVNDPRDQSLVGIGYATQELSRIEDAPWDVRLDYVASENELIDCT